MPHTDLLTDESDRGSSLTDASSSEIPQLTKQHEPAQLESEEMHLGSGYLKFPWDSFQGTSFPPLVVLSEHTPAPSLASSCPLMQN